MVPTLERGSHQQLSMEDGQGVAAAAQEVRLRGTQHRGRGLLLPQVLVVSVGAGHARDCHDLELNKFFKNLFLFIVSSRSSVGTIKTARGKLAGVAWVILPAPHGS